MPAEGQPRPVEVVAVPFPVHDPAGGAHHAFGAVARVQQRPDHVLEPRGRDPDVVVQQRQVLAARRPRRQVIRPGEAQIRRVGDDPDARMISLQRLARAVGGPVVEDDDLEGARRVVRLGQRAEARLQVGSSVEVDDDDRDLRPLFRHRLRLAGHGRGPVTSGCQRDPSSTATRRSSRSASDTMLPLMASAMAMANSPRALVSPTDRR